MLKCALFTLAAALAPMAASAQSKYGGGLVAADAGTRGFGTFTQVYSGVRVMWGF